jgi:hypothetical protein
MAGGTVMSPVLMAVVTHFVSSRMVFAVVMDVDLMCAMAFDVMHSLCMPL